MREPLPSGHRSERRIWSTRRAMAAHVALVIWIPGCAIACWWQVTVALSGDSLGWVYSVMWPCFAVFGTVFWWHFVHDDPDTIGRRGLRRLQRQAANVDMDLPGVATAELPGPAERERDAQHDERQRDAREPDAGELALARAEAEDPELAAYNAYLASLARDARPSTWRAR